MMEIKKAWKRLHLASHIHVIFADKLVFPQSVKQFLSSLSFSAFFKGKLFHSLF